MIETELQAGALLHGELVFWTPRPTDKSTVIQVLARKICEGGQGMAQKDLLYAVSQREKMGSTALGKGIAFCHARTDKIPNLTIAMAVCPEGAADFAPPDGVPVKIVLMFVIPKQHSDLYLRAMSALLRQLSNAAVMEKVLGAQSAADVVQAVNTDSLTIDLDSISELFARAKEEGVEPAAEVLARTPPPYLAELMEDLVPSDRRSFLGRMEPARAAAVMEYMRIPPAAAALRRMDCETAARILGYMNIARCADLIQQLGAAEQGAIIKHLGTRAGSGVHAVLKYPPSTAGGIMTPEVLSIGDDATVAQALKLIAAFPDRRQTDLYVVSQNGRLLGKASIHEVLAASADANVAQIMQRSWEMVQPEQNEEELRHLVARGHLRSVPVLGPHGTLLGVVTQDDLLDVVEKGASEDLVRLSGSEMVDPLHTPIATRMRMRLPWLLLTLGGELFIALVISKIFAPTLEKAVVLAAFIPAIMATGGNVGLQSTTMVIRSLGMGTLKAKHTRTIVLGELKLGILTGACCGVIAAVVAYMINWNYHEVVKVSVSVFLAMMSATFATSLVGTLEPLILHKLEFDPATACGPFVTMFNDIFGSIVYLLIATIMNFSPK
ncbi:MAG: magnesium transporter [Elusimicrobia bacterium]|nr:magnesium transporter [Elusimicrobiota bacterium]